MIPELPSAFAILETFAALAFVFFMMSLICSSVNEAICSLINLRGRKLRQGISKILNDENVDELFYHHPLVASMTKKSGGQGLPSKIPAKTFAIIMMNLIDIQGYPKKVSSSNVNSRTLSDDVVGGLQALLEDANGNLNKFRENIEHWYDASMLEVATWYKSHVQCIMMVIGFFLAIAMNVNAIAVTQALLKNPETRAQIIDLGQKVEKSQQAGTETTDAVAQFKDQVSVLKGLQMPIGWEGDTFDKLMSRDGWVMVLGWFLSGIAISFGAPFWFDLFNKLVAIRTGVKSSQKDT
ncbi:MAG: hypothetical protein JKY92_00545 [Magnetovibrio sp.]|nr:hypothetical protein [Magnetovibrio sp.]